jgi:hypothetical protein
MFIDRGRDTTPFSFWAKCYETFYGRNLRMFITIKSFFSMAGLSSLV